MIDRLKFWNRLWPEDRLQIQDVPGALADGFMLDLTPVEELVPPTGRKKNIAALIAAWEAQATVPLVLTAKGCTTNHFNGHLSAYQYQCGQITMAAQKQYIEYFLRAYPGAEFRAAGKNCLDPIAVFVGTKLVGALMGINLGEAWFTEAVK